MFAVVAGPTGDLIWQEVADVAPGPGEVLIAVHSAGVNRADILQAAGLYPPPAGASDIMGLEVSGTIADTGAGVTEFSVGQQVCALLAGGGYAQYVGPDCPGDARAGRRTAGRRRGTPRSGVHGVVQSGHGGRHDSR